MKPDDFEKHLGRQPLRPVPLEWREQILAAAREAAGSSQPVFGFRRRSLRAVLASLNARLSALLWPHPAAWAGLAAAWVVILGLHGATHDAPQLATRRAFPPSPQVFMAFQEQQRLLSELIGPHDAPATDRPKPALPRPRSERQSGLLMV